jgi:hypothetical protein
LSLCLHVLCFSPAVGGAGQCCTNCTTSKECIQWSYNAHTNECTLLRTVTGRIADPNSVAGAKGEWTTANWTSLPQHFLNSGYFTAGMLEW